MNKTKIHYYIWGEPKDNKRVKAHIGDVVKIVDNTRLQKKGIKKGMEGQVVRITNSFKNYAFRRYSDWYYKITFPIGVSEWIMSGSHWEVINTHV